MRKFVVKSNLPCDVSAVLMGEKYFEMLSPALNGRGIRVYSVPDNPCVDTRLSGHADLSICHAGGRQLFAANYLRDSVLNDELCRLGFEISYIDDLQTPVYPKDSQLNVCVIGKCVVYCNGVSCDSIVKYFDNSLVIKQGYVKCNICVVDENSVITSDVDAARKLGNAGYDVLQIRPGYIDLEGFPYGFIGGSSFKISDIIMAFTGKLDIHPDKQRIIEFLSDRGIEAIYLTDNNIFDVGSILPIYEK